MLCRTVGVLILSLLGLVLVHNFDDNLTRNLFDHKISLDEMKQETRVPTSYRLDARAHEHQNFTIKPAHSKLTDFENCINRVPVNGTI